METYESFAIRCLDALSGAIFLPDTTLTVVVASMVEGSFPPPAGQIICSARRGNLFFSCSGYPAERAEDGVDLGYAEAELIVFEGAHEALGYLLETIGAGRVSTVLGSVEDPLTGSGFRALWGAS